MSDSKKNLDKLKQICQQLNDRDYQLKINASTLWDILDGLCKLKIEVESISCSCEKNQLKITELAKKIENLCKIAEIKGCKKVNHEH